MCVRGEVHQFLRMLASWQAGRVHSTELVFVDLETSQGLWASLEWSGLCGVDRRAIFVARGAEQRRTDQDRAMAALQAGITLDLASQRSSRVRAGSMHVTTVLTIRSLRIQLTGSGSGCVDRLGEGEAVHTHSMEARLCVATSHMPMGRPAQRTGVAASRRWTSPAQQRRNARTREELGYSCVSSTPSHAISSRAGVARWIGGRPSLEPLHTGGSLYM